MMSAGPPAIPSVSGELQAVGSVRQSATIAASTRKLDVLPGTKSQRRRGMQGKSSAASGNCSAPARASAMTCCMHVLVSLSDRLRQGVRRLIPRRDATKAVLYATAPQRKKSLPPQAAPVLVLISAPSHYRLL